MANTNQTVSTQDLPDWWQREKRRRQTLVLIFLVVLLVLIGFYYWESVNGRIGQVSGINFDSRNYIVFVRQEKHPNDNEYDVGLYAIRADGSGVHRLTESSDRSDKSAPAWTIDGKSILYSSNKDDSKYRQIFILGDGEPRQLTYGKSNKDAPTASPDGQHAAFVTQGAVKTVYLNGNDVYQVMPAPRAGNNDSDDSATAGAIEPNTAFLTAAFSSDGRGIAGVQELNGEITQIPVSGDVITPGDQVVRAIPPTGGDPLFLDTGHEVSFAWEPKGTRLACSFTEIDAKLNASSTLVSGIRIWSFANPKHPTTIPVLAALGYSIEPRNIAWSADGTKLAFEVWRIKSAGVREPLGVVVMGIPDQGIRISPANVKALPCMLPATASAQPGKPKWSPDGKRILFELTRADHGHDLCVVNLDGTGLINLTNGQGDNTQANWSPVN